MLKVMNLSSFIKFNSVALANIYLVLLLGSLSPYVTFWWILTVKVFIILGSIIPGGQISVSFMAWGKTLSPQGRENVQKVRSKALSASVRSGPRIPFNEREKWWFPINLLLN